MLPSPRAANYEEADAASFIDIETHSFRSLARSRLKAGGTKSEALEHVLDEEDELLAAKSERRR